MSTNIRQLKDPVSGDVFYPQTDIAGLVSGGGPGIDAVPTAGSVKPVQSGGVSFLGERQKGYINSGTWTSVDSTFRMHYIVKIPPALAGTKINFKGGSGSSSLMCLSAYNPVEGADAGVLFERAISPNTEYISPVPSGTNFIYVFAKSGDEDRTPVKLLLGDIDLLAPSTEAINTLYGGLKSTNDFVKQVQPAYCLWYGSGGKPNVNSANNTLTFVSETIILVGNVYKTIPANTAVSLTASGTVNSVILFKPSDVTFRAVSRAVAYDTSEEIVFGFATTANNQSKQFYFPFNYAVDGVDNSSLKASIDEINASLDDFVNNEDFEAHIEDFDVLNDKSQYVNKDYYHQGYINNGQWENIGSGLRYYYCIPIFVKEDSQYEILTSSSGMSSIYFLTQNNPVNGQSAGVVGSEILSQNRIHTGTVPAGAKYLYMLALSSTDRVPQKVNIDGVDYLKQSKETLAELGYQVYHMSDEGKTGILDLNPKNDVIVKLNNLNKDNTLSLLHFSDLHSYTTNLSRIKRFVEEYSALIDDVIHTGDLVGTVITGGIPNEWPDDWLSVVGNHDANIYDADAPVDKWISVPSKDSYDTLIGPFISNWGVVQPAGAEENDYYPCYYYKDYAGTNIRLIVLDDQLARGGGPTHWDATEKSWFETVLADAITNEKHVIVALHYPPFNIAHTDNPFDSIGHKPDGDSWHPSNEIPNAVKDFIDGGGTFICYLSGHSHDDYFGLSSNSNWNNQLSIGVGGALMNYTGGDCDRAAGTKGQDCFNLVGIDTVRKLIKIARIGVDRDRYMRKKDTLCWDYDNNQLIYVN